jgi:UDP-N-acetylglucosamine transferase subunit ALG13
MIFVTVGSDLPFDRLVREVDGWAQRTERRDVFAQIGATDWKPTFIPYSKFLEPADFQRRLTASSIIISHSGMGTILSALSVEKPILVFPRRASLREARNDHQLATARYLSDLGKIRVALDEAALRHELNQLATLRAAPRIQAYADEGLLSALRNFIHAS